MLFKQISHFTKYSREETYSKKFKLDISKSIVPQKDYK